MTAKECFTLIMAIKVFDKFKLRATVLKHALHNSVYSFVTVDSVCASVSV